MTFPNILSDNFTLEEFLHSDTAIAMGIDNSPEPEHYRNMVNLCQNFLQPLRSILKTKIKITSGYRSQALNDAIKNSSKTSFHMKGMAADFYAEGNDNYTLVKYIKILCTDAVPDLPMYDQLILEDYGKPWSWIHVSFKPSGNRGLDYTAFFDNGKVRYANGFVLE